MLNKELIDNELKLEIINLYKYLNETNNNLKFINFNLIREKLLSLSFAFMDLKKSFSWIDLYDEYESIDKLFITTKKIEMNILEYSLEDIETLFKNIHNIIYQISYKYKIILK